MAITNKALQVQVLKQRFALDLANALRTSTERQMALAGKNFGNLIEAYAENATNKSALRDINQTLAYGMQQAALAAYKENVLQEAAAPSYRGDDADRYAGGKLLDALGNPSMAIGSTEGIGFINVGLLDQTAKQWSRLNFGASPGQGFTGGERPAVAARIQFGSNQGFTLTLGGGMGSGFNVPQRGSGYFTNAGQFFLGFPGGRNPGNGRFQSTGGFGGNEIPIVQGRRSQHGIAPRRYLDQGLIFLAEAFGPAYISFFNDALTEAVSETRASIISNVGRA